MNICALVNKNNIFKYVLRISFNQVVDKEYNNMYIRRWNYRLKTINNKFINSK
jgi:hypothetical protein